MKNLWSLADIIDLHFFLRSDEEFGKANGEQALAKRDRIMFLAKIQPHFGTSEKIPPRMLIRKWLSVRRLQFQQEKGHQGQPLPGTIWQEVLIACRLLFLLAGIGCGAGLAGSLLLYTGATPVNVAFFFALFVLAPLLLALLQGVLLLLRFVRRDPAHSAGLYALIGRLLLRVFERARQRVRRGMPGAARLEAAVFLGALEQRAEFAAPFFWPVFLLLQLGAIGLSCGVLGATLARVVFADIAFVWQSSLQVSAATVARLVEWVALPWAWVPDGYPSLEQVSGSQMVLKEGVASLATSDLVSWWPFLCCAVVCYGLLPRLVLLLFGLRWQQRALDGLHFASLGFWPLLQRLTAPSLEVNGQADLRRELPAPQLKEDGAALWTPSGSLAHFSQAEGDEHLLLVPDELYDDCPLAQLARHLKQGGAPEPTETIRFGAPDDDGTWLGRLRQASQNRALASVMMLQEAWQPPLRETEQFLRRIRHTVGTTTPLIIVLVGRPNRETICTPVAAEQLEVWQKRMQALGDPLLATSTLVSS